MNYDFREKIDYKNTSATPIWGNGDEDTNKYLETANLTGNWLNLAAGDGRYMQYLVRSVETVVVNDIDEDALDKLMSLTPDQHKSKVKRDVFDITREFPLQDASFDGVFCTGTLHLFPEEVLEKIGAEIARVTKSGGRLLVDLATDVKRVLPNGKLSFNPLEPRYTLESGRKELEKVFRGYDLKFIESAVPEEEVKESANPHVFSCNFWLVDGIKKL